MSQVSPPAWLDKNFLETALAGSVDSFEVRTMGAVGDGYTSALLRVKVQLKSGKTENVVVKRLVQTNENSKFITETTMFDREILMYKETLPQLQKLLEKAFPGDVQPIAPRHFYSCDGTVVMEDLSASGFTMPDRREGMDLEHTLLLMRTAARFHAASVVLYQQVDPESMALYSKSIFSEAPINNMRKFFTGMTLLLADEVKKWPEYGEEYSKKLRAMAPKMLDLCIAGSKRDEKRFNVLTHDDLWINNIMLRGSTDIRFIDFQMPHFASPGNELHLILMSSLEDEVRRKHKDVLMKEYHTSLCDTLTVLGHKNLCITLEELKEEYAKSSLYGLVLAVVYLPAMLCSPGYDVPMFDSDCSLDNSIYDDSKFEEVMREILREYEQLGAFELAEKYIS